MNIERNDKEVALENAIADLIHSNRPTDKEIGNVQGLIRTVIDESDPNALDKIKGTNHPMIQGIIEKL